jgi:formylglycine-generating enzyme required for sulfatase activity
MLRRGAACVSILGVVASVSGCSLLFTFDDLVGVPADARGDAGAAACPRCGGAGCAPCPTVPQIEVTSDAGIYKIDKYEVTNAEYMTWLKTSPSVAAQAGGCAEWNTDFTPGVTNPRTVAALEDAGALTGTLDDCSGNLDSGDQKPVVCIDWCDAVAYCAWAKKHLCGRIGGGSIDVTTDGPYADPNTSEWYRACSNAGTQQFPYPGAYDPTAHRCNDMNHGPDDVGTRAGCEGGFAGLFDMSGNVSEWENACTSYTGKPPVAQNCLRRGGAFWGQTAADLACDAKSANLQGLPYNSVGFRCCAGP